MKNSLLRELSKDLAVIVRAGETDWEKLYKRDPRSFRALIRAEAGLEDSLRRYFKGLYSRLYKLVDFKEYRTQAIKAYDVVVKVSDDQFQAEMQIMMNFIADDMLAAGTAGAAAAIFHYSPGYPIDNLNAEIAKAINKLSFQDAKGIMDATRELMRTSLQTSVNLGETDQQAMERLRPYIDSDRRALTIARTESVRAYNAGTLSFGRLSGATEKTWHVVNGACKICLPNEEQTIGFNDLFNSGDDAPPAHPNCRCSVSLVYADGTEEANYA